MIQPEKSLNIRLCSKHKDQLQYFCSDPCCSKLLCCQCLATGEHNNHDWKDLSQAFLIWEDRLKQAGHATQDAADTAKHQMDALRTEREGVVSKCNTAKSSIHSKIESIRSQINDRKSFLRSNLEHATRRHRYLNHTQPRKALTTELQTVQELLKNEEITLANLASRDPMSLGEVQKANESLKNVQSKVKNIQCRVMKQQSSHHVSQFNADSKSVQNHLSNFGEVAVGTFTPKAPSEQHHSSDLQPYEWEFQPKQRQRSASVNIERPRTAIQEIPYQLNYMAIGSHPSRNLSLQQLRIAENKIQKRLLPLTPSNIHMADTAPYTSTRHLLSEKDQDARFSPLLGAHQHSQEETYEDVVASSNPPLSFSVPSPPPPPPFAPLPPPPPPLFAPRLDLLPLERIHDDAAAIVADLQYEEEEDVYDTVDTND